MNVILPKKEKMNKKAVALYVVSIAICVIAAIVVACSQYLGANELDSIIVGSTNPRTQQEIDEEELKAGFDNLFTNQIENYQTKVQLKKIDESKNLVYPYYEKQERQENNYDIDVCIPMINIDNDVIRKYNEAIEGDFVEKAKDVVESENKNTIYTVEYIATVEDDILSLMVRSNLKEGTSAQRIIIQTYHFDLKNNKEVTLEEVLSRRGIQVAVVENKVKQEIEVAQRKVEDLKALGYSIFSRNLKDEMYQVKNTHEFFMRNGTIYLIYAYGNEALTSEIDLVVL